METWPQFMPNPATDFSVDNAPNAIRTGMESGAIRQRRRFATEVVSAKVTWELSDTEFAVFVGFHKFNLNLGADYFIIPLPVGGNEMVNHVARFENGQFEHSFVPAANWTVTAKLDIRERVTISQDLLDLYLNTGFDEASLEGFILSVDAFHTFVHVTAPVNLN